MNTNNNNMKHLRSLTCAWKCSGAGLTDHCNNLKEVFYTLQISSIKHNIIPNQVKKQEL